ncbi:MAG: HepT-like ribonuclease domain-containing protein [Candidatus Thermoplasmatota archaeon]|nr:HepT-like ribonuclease domain-containing protein [Candidatus Thermoplasmatota archaeon]
MDPERVARIADKLAHAEERLGQFEAWAPTALEDVRDRLASYKAFQEAVEAVMDVIAMIAKEVGATAKDDYTNIERLEGEALTAVSADALREANGLRNRLVHEYNGLSDQLALASGEDLTARMRRAIKEVRAWTSEAA